MYSNWFHLLRHLWINMQNEMQLVIAIIILQNENFAFLQMMQHSS